LLLTYAAGFLDYGKTGLLERHIAGVVEVFEETGLPSD
jgi:hypothetical protein